MTDDQTPTDHVVVCGFGAVGRAVARELQDAEATYVVIGSQAQAERASILGIRFVCGDPASSDALLAAGVARARALVACGETGAENIATTLAAHALRADVPVMAPLAGDDDEQKILRAGARSVVSPATTAAAELARQALYASGPATKEDFRVQELTVAPASSGAGHRISALRGGAFVVGLRRRDGSFLPLPPGETQLRPGDTVLALGTPATLARLEVLLVTATLTASAPASMGLPRTTRRL
jgi:voltage-gated potassium channel